MAFPTNPTNNQTYNDGTYTYRYNSTFRTWTKIAQTTSNVSNVVTSSGNITTGNTTITGSNLSVGNTVLSTSNVTVGNTIVSSSNVSVGNTTITNSNVVVGNTVISNNELSGNLANGNTSISIPSANGNITFSSAGTANVLVISGSGTDVTGNLAVTANSSANNISTTNQITAGNGLQVTTGSLSVLAGNLDVTGNLNVTGNVNYSNVTDLVVGDPLIYIGENNPGDTYDLGIVASYSNGTSVHTGIARNASDDVWTFFDGVTAEPTTIIDWANATYPTVKVGTIIATSNANLGNLVVANFFQGDGGLLSNLPGGTSLANGTSNITIPAVNGNIIFNVGGSTDEVVVTSTGINVAGYVTATGNITGANLTSTRIITRTSNNGATTSGTITPNADTSDQFNLIGLTDTVTIAIPSGTFTDGQKLTLRIKDNGVSRTLNWTTNGANSYRVVGTTLPATTTAGKVTYVGCVYNSQDSFWDVVAVTTQA